MLIGRLALTALWVLALTANAAAQSVPQRREAQVGPRPFYLRVPSLAIRHFRGIAQLIDTSSPRRRAKVGTHNHQIFVVS